LSDAEKTVRTPLHSILHFVPVDDFQSDHNDLLFLIQPLFRLPVKETTNRSYPEYFGMTNRKAEQPSVNSIQMILQISYFPAEPGPHLQFIHPHPVE